MMQSEISKSNFDLSTLNAKSQINSFFQWFSWTTSTQVETKTQGVRVWNPWYLLADKINWYNFCTYSKVALDAIL